MEKTIYHTTQGFPFSANCVTALCLIFNLIQERGWNSTKIEQMSLEN